MASGNLRSIEVLASGLTGWLLATTADRGRPTVTSVRHATDGFANETVIADVAWTDHEGETLVVRMPPMEPSFPDYDLGMQAVVQIAVAEAQVPAPAPVSYVRDEQWLGQPFLVMPYIAGHVPGPAPLFDPWVAESGELLQRRLHDRFIETVGAIHGVDWRAHHLDRHLHGADGSIDAALDRWERYLTWAADGAPLAVLSDALDWCRHNQPDDASDRRQPVLLWGDARMGNLIMDEDREVRAVLDWELASLGPPEMDLAWYLALDAMLETLVGQRVEGFPGREGTIAYYEAVTGRTVDALVFHETFALTRALAINDRQARVARQSGQAYIGGSDAENPMVAILANRLR